MLIGRYERQVVTTGITHRVQIGWWEGGEEYEGGEGGGGRVEPGQVNTDPTQVKGRKK